MFQQYLKSKKADILQALEAYITMQKGQHNICGSSWGTDALNRLLLYIQHGKCIRGTLVFLGHDIQGRENNEDVVKLALAMEFFHAGLLIHDDIMDNAAKRRSLPSLHTAYKDLLHKKNLQDPDNTGKSLAICVGNVSFFLGMQLIADLNRKDINVFCSQELQIVNYAQMMDIAYGATDTPVQNLDDILTLYQNKTGRYSVLLPLTLGARLGNAKESSLKHIKKFSDNIGIAYQLTDDKLDLFGNPEQTGKAVGTDIREGKQTPYVFFLRQIEDTNIRNHVEELLSQRTATEEDIAWIRKQIHTYHIEEKINTMTCQYKNQAIEAISRIPMKETERNLFLSFVDYLTNRIQ